MAIGDYPNNIGRIRDSLWNESEKYVTKLKEIADPKADDEDDKDERDRTAKLVERALEFFKVASTAEEAQRQRELVDLQFDRALREDQWPANILTERDGTIASDGSIVGARPCLVIPKLDQPVQQVVNEARNARIAVMIKPKSNSKVETANVVNGLYRSIQVTCGAHVVRIGALERAAKCGRGFYRVNKAYANDGDLDLDIVISRILNQGSVYLDPFAQEPDWSDGMGAIITNDLPFDEYKRRYSKSKMANFTEDQLSSTLNRMPGWVAGEESARLIRIAEFFYVEIETRARYYIPGVGYKWADELKGVTPDPAWRKRDVEIRNVKWCIVNCEEVLEEEDWDGRYIPIIPVIGKEYNIDGDRCFKGIVSNSKDAQRSYNYMRSAQVEAVGLAPKAPYIMAEGQDEGYEAMWDQLNTKNYTRLKYKPLDYEGHLLPPPQRNVAEPAIQAISMAVNMADNDIKATTGRFDPSLGRARADQSGKAINLLKEAGENTTGNYLENLTSISMRYEAKVVLDLIPKVYDREGRRLRVLGEEDQDDKDVIVNQPMVETPQGPMPAPPPGMMQQLGGMVGRAMGRPQPKPPKMIDLRDFEGDVEISVGKSYDTQRDQNADLIRTIIEAAPGLTPLLADLLIENMDSPIAKRAAARIRKSNPMLQGEEGEEQDPQALQAKLQALQAQHQELTQALEQTSEELKTQKFKVDADAKLKQFEAQSRERVANLQVNAAMQQAELKAKTDYDIASMKIQADIRQAEIKAQHDEEMVVREAAVGGIERQEQQQHERTMKVADIGAKDRQSSQQLAAKDQSERRSLDQKNASEQRTLIQKDQGERRDVAADSLEGDKGRQHESRQSAEDRAHSSTESAEQRRHDSTESAEQRKHDAKQAAAKPKEKK